MDAIETHFSLRSRLSERIATGPTSPAGTDFPTVDDPFAGDDEPWAVEDWVEDGRRRMPQTAEDEPARFIVGLVLGLGLSALAWLALALGALQAYQLIT